MIHPATELRFVSPEIGHGVFATADIPRGTIVYALDQLEVALTPRAYAALDDVHRAVLDRYAYVDEHGTRILSWDHAKYVNHRCDCNTMSTGWGFEIAIEDIAAGEEITDEYGLLNLPGEWPLSCGCSNCRRVLRPDDVDRHGADWDRTVQRALTSVRDVPQPLWGLLDLETRSGVRGWLEGTAPYRSVSTLKYRGPEPTGTHPGRNRRRGRALAA